MPSAGESWLAAGPAQGPEGEAAPRTFFQISRRRHSSDVPVTSCPICEARLPPGARFCEDCGAAVHALGADAPPGASALIGGRYRTVRRLGEGGMGVVHEAEQLLGETVRRVAVKVLHPSLGRDRALATRFHRECATIARLEHPNTIEIFDFGTTTEGGFYFAMELVTGRSLAQEIERGPLPLARVVNVIRQVAGALDEAHGLGIVHRDLKPENVMLTHRAGDPDFVKVLDFGIAADLSRDASATKLTRAGAVLGTPPYMSPEQFTSETIDARSDVYALGVIVYELLTARLPFSASTPWEWARCHTSVAPAPLGAAVPPDVARVIARALSTDRAARPDGAGVFAAARAAAAEAADAAATLGRATTVPTAPLSVPHLWLARASIRTEGAVSADVARTTPRASPRRPWALAAGATVIAAVAGAGYAHVTTDPAVAAPLGPASVPTTLLAPLEPEAPNPDLPIATPREHATNAPRVAPRAPASREPVHPVPAPQGEAPATDPPPAALPRPDPPVALPLPPPPHAKPEPVDEAPAEPAAPAGRQGDAACSAGVALAKSGAIEAAAGEYHACKATGGSAGALRTLAAKLRGAAPGAARAAAFNGDCGRAGRIARSVAGIPGAAAPTSAAVAGTRCAE